MANRRDDDEKDERYDPKGERGGDTGKTSQLGEGPGAEKGDQRRENPVHAGPTRGGSKGTTARHRSRTGSDSDASH